MGHLDFGFRLKVQSFGVYSLYKVLHKAKEAYIHTDTYIQLLLDVRERES